MGSLKPILRHRLLIVWTKISARMSRSVTQGRASGDLPSEVREDHIEAFGLVLLKIHVLKASSTHDLSNLAVFN